MEYTIENDTIAITVDTFGGELQSLRKKDSGTEYLWCGDPAYWGRRSPILFPFVGSLKNKCYKYEGKEYPMSQHGFARDMEFEMIKKTSDELWFELRSNESTRELYPFEFSLQLGYVINGNQIAVMWRVANTDRKTMYFSIGGHPAFRCPIDPSEKQKDYYLRFHTESNLRYEKINEDGLVYLRENILELNNGITEIHEHLFDEDALIFAEPEFNQIELLTPQKVPYLRIISEMPLLGIWSPAKKQAPFVCIEPWCGRCDAVDFDGELRDRAYGHTLQPGQIFEKSYNIILM